MWHYPINESTAYTSHTTHNCDRLIGSTSVNCGASVSRLFAHSPDSRMSIAQKGQRQFGGRRHHQRMFGGAVLAASLTAGPMVGIAATVAHRQALQFVDDCACFGYENGDGKICKYYAKNNAQHVVRLDSANHNGKSLRKV